MWCIPTITPTFIVRMEDILTLYEKPYDPLEPVLCMDEKSRQLLADTHPLQRPKEGVPQRRDYEYVRGGTKNLFVTVEPKAGYREITVTSNRKKADFAREVRRIVDLPRYRDAKKIHIVVDNLNTHFESSFYETFGEEEARRVLSRLQFHYTPVHASWLNMAEIEIGILDHSYLGTRVATEKDLRMRARQCVRERNKKGATISWSFTVKHARTKFKYGGQN
jgi:hypothetical protein